MDAITYKPLPERYRKNGYDYELVARTEHCPRPMKPARRLLRPVALLLLWLCFGEDARVEKLVAKLLSR